MECSLQCHQCRLPFQFRFFFPVQFGLVSKFPFDKIILFGVFFKQEEKEKLINKEYAREGGERERELEKEEKKVNSIRTVKTVNGGQVAILSQVNYR